MRFHSVGQLRKHAQASPVSIPAQLKLKGEEKNPKKFTRKTSVVHSVNN